MNQYLENILIHISRFGMVEIIILFLGIFMNAVLRFFFRIFSKQAVYNNVLRGGRVQNIIDSLAENRTRLDASHILVTRIHNGVKWLNGEHMNKLSIYKSFTIFKKLFFTAKLNDIKLSELSDLLISVIDIDYDIISVAELPNSFEYKQVLKTDKVKYIALFKIQKSNKVLGYIFVLFQNGKVAKYDKEVYQDFLRVATEIAEEFA